MHMHLNICFYFLIDESVLHKLTWNAENFEIGTYNWTNVLFICELLQIKQVSVYLFTYFIYGIQISQRLQDMLANNINSSWESKLNLIFILDFNYSVHFHPTNFPHDRSTNTRLCIAAILWTGVFAVFLSSMMAHLSYSHSVLSPSCTCPKQNKKMKWKSSPE